MVNALRIQVPSTGHHYVVKDGQVYGDLDGDGRIGKQEKLSQDPPGTSIEALTSAARYLADYFEEAHPGTKSADGKLKSAGPLNQKELRAFEDGGAGIAAKRRDVWAHLDYFDGKSRDGTVGLAENFAGWRALGYGLVRSALGSAASAVIFGAARSGFAVDVEAIQARRPKRVTAVYDRETGNIDPARLESFLAAFDEKGGTLTHEELAQVLKEKADLGLVPKQQFKSLFELTLRMNGEKTVTRSQFEGLYDGSLLYLAAELHKVRGS